MEAISWNELKAREKVGFHPNLEDVVAIIGTMGNSPEIQEEVPQSLKQKARSAILEAEEAYLELNPYLAEVNIQDEKNKSLKYSAFFQLPEGEHCWGFMQIRPGYMSVNGGSRGDGRICPSAVSFSLALPLGEHKNRTVSAIRAIWPFLEKVRHSPQENIYLLSRPDNRGKHEVILTGHEEVFEELGVELEKKPKYYWGP